MCVVSVVTVGVVKSGNYVCCQCGDCGCCQEC